MKGWYGNRQQHSLASKGIRSSNNMKAFGERYHDFLDRKDYVIEDVEIYINELNAELGENAVAVPRWSPREGGWNINIIEEE